MHCYQKNILISTSASVDIINITDSVSTALGESGIVNGVVTVLSRHTTTALTINEFEPRLLDDLVLFLEKLAPHNARYLHNDIHLRDCPPDEPENAHAHLWACLLSQSESIPVVDGRLSLGQWQSVQFLELDGPRDREIQLMIMGQ